MANPNLPIQYPKNVYVGARYVPKFADPVEWSADATYEPLTIVTYQGNSYTSRTFVPAGVLPTDEVYWAATGNYNAQVEQYRQDVLEVNNQIATIKGSLSEMNIYMPLLNSQTNGSGGGTLVQTPNKWILIDTGQYENRNEIKNYFQQFTTSLDVIIITHYHYDHVDNMQFILDNFEHENCIAYLPLNPLPYYTGPETEDLTNKYNNTVSALTNAGVQIQFINSNFSVEIEEGYKLQFYNSTEADYTYYKGVTTNYNNYSMQTYFYTPSNSVLFPGDILKVGQQRVYELGHALPCNVLNAPHHGIGENGGDDFFPYFYNLSPEVLIVQGSAAKIASNLHTSTSSRIYPPSVTKLSTAKANVNLSLTNGAVIINEGESYELNGDGYFLQTIWIDNEAPFNGNGTKSNPFNNFAQALMYMSGAPYTRYVLEFVPRSDPYPTMFIRGFEYIEIHGQNSSFNYVYVSECKRVEFFNCVFNCVTPRNNALVNVVVNHSYAYFNACSFLGAISTLPIQNMSIESSEVYITTCNFTGNKMTQSFPFITNRFGKLLTSGLTFNSFGSVYNLNRLTLYLLGSDTVVDCDHYLYAPSYGTETVQLNVRPSDELIAKGYGGVTSTPWMENNSMWVIAGGAKQAIQFKTVSS